MHEFVISLTQICKENMISAIDFAKRILDYGFHAPTVFFPLTVENALMIEPTETESKKTLEDFAKILKNIINEAKINRELVVNAPQNTAVKRINEINASRNLILKHKLK